LKASKLASQIRFRCIDALELNSFGFIFEAALAVELGFIFGGGSVL